MSSMAATTTSAEQQGETEMEVTTLVPTKEKLLSDMKAFISHHEMSTAMGNKLLIDSKSAVQEATREIENLHSQLFDLKTQLKGAENLRKENANLKTTLNDASASLHWANIKNDQLEATLKDKAEQLSRSEVEIGKLTEYKQKVELAQMIFSQPFKNVQIDTDARKRKTCIAICDAEASNDGAGAGTGTSESEPSTSEKKFQTRGVARARRGRPF